MQRVVAKYGSPDGTKTRKAKVTAENKQARYYVELGKAQEAAALKKNRI